MVTASPYAVITWFVMMLVLSQAGLTVTNPTTLLFMFLFFAPTWLVGEYVFDMIRFRKEKP